jgi:anti-anti-sigma factor
MEPAAIVGSVATPGPIEKPPKPALQLEVAVINTATGVDVRLRGHAGVKEAGPLEAVLRRLAAQRLAHVTFDLSELQSISSLVMGMLVFYRRAAIRTGGRVFLAANLQPAVLAALNRTQLKSLFEAVGSPQ